MTIGSGVSEGAGVEFPTFPLTCVVVLKTLWHYRASVWYSTLVNSLPAAFSCFDLIDFAYHHASSSCNIIVRHLVLSSRASVTDYQLVRLCVFSSAILFRHRRPPSYRLRSLTSLSVTFDHRHRSSASPSAIVLHRRRSTSPWSEDCLSSCQRGRCKKSLLYFLFGVASLLL